MSPTLSHSPSTSIRPPEERSEAEQRWVSYQPYLHSKGYRLRPRYQPDWIPSWTITGADPYDCEDSSNSLPLRRLDATRISDELQVVIKMLIPSSNDREGKQELEILQHFSKSSLKNDPANHIVPCLDSFPIPDVEGGMFFVTPLLGKYKNPPFYNISEIYDFLAQIFEGLEFLHKHDVAHCDIAPANIMMDKGPLYDQPSHPYHQHLTLDAKRPLHPRYNRSQKPVRYYYIDFGYAVWFKDSTTPREITGAVGKEIAPEQLSGAAYDPFKVDIYQLGAILRRDLLTKYDSIGFLLPLARDMTNSDPSKRPTIQHARHTMSTHFAGLSGWQARRPIISPSATFRQRWMATAAGLVGEVSMILRMILRMILFRC